MNQDIESMILDQLMGDIHNHKYASKEKLPSENELADYYKVSRIIIRRVYIRLQEMGYIYSEQGKGRFLKERPQLIELVLSGDESFTKKMVGKGYDLVTQNIFCEKEPCDYQMLQHLRIHPKEDVYKIGRLRIVNHRPIALHVSYVASSLFPNIHKEGKTITSMFNYYRSMGSDKFESEKIITYLF